MLEWRPEKSCGPCMAGGDVTSVVYALGKMEVGVQGTVGMSIAGACAQCATSQFAGVTACSGIAQTGCRSGMGLLDKAGVHAQGTMSPLGSQLGQEGIVGQPDGKYVGSGTPHEVPHHHSGRCGVHRGVCMSATSSPDGVMAGSGSVQCFNAVM